jgi:UDP-3-O-[3-hydroxymyristoyl] glucosamine N-acyltransferase
VCEKKCANLHIKILTFFQMEFSAIQIASLVGGTVEGDGNVAVSTFAKIEEGHQGALSFLANPKYTHYIYQTKSSVVLVRRDFVAEHPVSATLIRVDDPYATVAQLLQMVSAMTAPKLEGVEQPSFVAEGVEVPEGAYIGAFAYISAGAKLGKNVKIYPQVYVGAGVEIGDDTTLYPGVKVYHGCRIGARCIIHSGAVIGADGFGFAPTDGVYKKIPQLGNVVIADDVEIGANTAVDRAVMGSTRIGKGVKLDNLIQVAHNCEVGDNTVMASQSGIAGSTKLGNGCVVGGQVGFAGHLHISDNVQIGAQSGISRDVAAGARIMGYPAVEYGDFARQTINVRNLSKLYSRVSELEKQLKELNGDAK